MTWASVSLADKLDTVAGLFAAGMKPTGSRDPYGLRRAAQGIVKTLADLPDLGVPGSAHLDLARLLTSAAALHNAEPDGALADFFAERSAHLFERRGYGAGESRVVGTLRAGWARPHEALKRVDALATMRGSEAFLALASLFKRVKNITKGIDDRGQDLGALKAVLVEPAEVALADALQQLWPRVEADLAAGRYGQAVQILARLQPAVDRFFIDVLVMADDPRLREARLALLTRLRSAVLEHIGDISEIGAEER